MGFDEGGWIAEKDRRAAIRHMQAVRNNRRCDNYLHYREIWEEVLARREVQWPLLRFLRRSFCPCCGKKTAYFLAMRYDEFCDDYNRPDEKRVLYACPTCELAEVQISYRTGKAEVRTLTGTVELHLAYYLNIC